MIHGNETEFKGEGYVAFLDILGFSSEIKNGWEKGTPTPLDKIKSFKEAIEKAERAPTGLLAEEGLCFYSSRRYSVSDSIIVSLGATSHGADRAFEAEQKASGLVAVLHDIKTVWKHAIFTGYTLRGALDFGHVYWNRSETIGPAFIEAYELESKAARVSRVILSSRCDGLLHDLLRHLGDRGAYLSRFFIKDFDGYVILNPHCLYDTPGERLELISSLEHMKEKSDNHFIREKYSPLLSILSDESLRDHRITVGELGQY